MNIDNDIWVLDESKISQAFESREEIQKPQEGLVEQVIRQEEPPQSATLILQGDEIIRINTFPFVVGKSRMADFTVEGNTYISRKHCRITKRDGKFYIEDLNSTNGTFLDGEQIRGRTELKKGMQLVLADRKYRVTWED